METQALLADYRRSITSCANAFFSRWRKEAVKAGKMPIDMVEKFAAVFLKGKLLRGALVVLGYNLAGGTKQEDILKASLAVELLHTSFLIADDVFDNDDTRRGEPSLHKQWGKQYSSGVNSEHLGKSLAFDTTIVGLLLAPLALENTSFSNKVKQQALFYYFRKGVETGWGEGLDIVSPSESLKNKRKAFQVIHDYKTVEYSGVLPLHFGALLAGKTEKEWLTALDEYGRNLGRIFQIKDDIIGSFGNSQITGKANDGDIKQARWTVLMELLFEKMNEKETEKVSNILGKQKVSDKDISYIKSLMQQYSTVPKAREKAQEFLTLGLACVPTVTQDPAHQDTLKNILYFMLEREK